MGKIEEDKKRIIYNTILTSIVLIYFLASFCVKSFFVVFEKIAIYIAPTILIIFVIINIKYILKKNSKILVLLLFDIGFVLFGALFNNTGLGSIGQMVTTILIFFTIPFVKVSNKFMSKILWIIIVLYILFMCAEKSYMNPNYVGYMYILYYLLFITLIILKNDSYKNSQKIILFILITLITIYNVNITKCRSALLGIAVMVFVFTLIPYRIYKSKKNRIIISIFITIGSLIFSYIYVVLWKNNFRVDLSFFTKKSLYSGRNLIWQEAFSLLEKNLIFGVGSNQILTSQPEYALHNFMHMVTLTFGIPNLICLFFIISKCLNNIFLEVQDKKILKFIYSIMIALFVIDFFESYIFWAEYNIIFFIIITLCVSKNQNEREKD